MTDEERLARIEREISRIKKAIADVMIFSTKVVTASATPPDKSDAVFEEIRVLSDRIAHTLYGSDGSIE